MTSQFTAEVFPAELKEIELRRRGHNLPGPELEGPPNTNKGLTGLALSGGGIRSSTVCLGAIQGLIKRNQFKSIDYLSTVSGGGYIGSCISSVLNKPEASDTVFEDVDGSADSTTVKHLRNSCDYLIAGTAVDRMRVPMILLRGLLLNIWLILSALIPAVFFTELLTELWHVIGSPVVSPLIICTPFLILSFFYPSVVRIFGNSFDWEMRNFYEKGLATLFVSSITGMILIMILWLVSLCIDNNWDGEISNYFQSSIANSGALQVGVVIGIIISLVLFLKLSRFFPIVRRFIINTIFAVVGPMVVFSAYLLMCIFFVESPYFDDNIDAIEGTTGTIKYSQILNQLVDKDLNMLTEDENENFKLLLETLRKNKLDLPEIIDANYSIKIQNKSSKADNPATETIWLLSAGKTYSTTIETAGDFLFLPQKSLFNLHAEWGFYGTGLLLLILNFIFFDANVTSTHGFYRDRLSRAFLIRMSSDGSVEANDNQKLSTLNSESNIAPYHLINTTLNLPNSKAPGSRWRKSDFFTLSKCYAGSEHTGYCTTKDLEDVDRNLNLGSAMAISAAAATPNMGTETKNYFVFIMTLLNLRLGYWIPNPSKIVPASQLRKLLWPTVGPQYLFREAFGKLDDRGSHVNLSDGGHIENLAIYQLLKRHCKLIIAIDSEADPDATFKGLVTLIRYANIDLGIRIDINIENMKKNSNGLSNSHWTLAKIHYGADENGIEETGHLLYLKSSLTGDENEYIKAYKNSEPTFPHQSTADQNFNETQFEVYRSLGEHIAHTALDDAEVQKILAMTS